MSTEKKASRHFFFPAQGHTHFYFRKISTGVTHSGIAPSYPMSTSRENIFTHRLEPNPVLTFQLQPLTSHYFLAHNPILLGGVLKRILSLWLRRHSMSGNENVTLHCTYMQICTDISCSLCHNFVEIPGAHASITIVLCRLIIRQGDNLEAELNPCCGIP